MHACTIQKCHGYQNCWNWRTVFRDDLMDRTRNRSVSEGKNPQPSATAESHSTNPSATVSKARKMIIGRRKLIGSADERKLPPQRRIGKAKQNQWSDIGWLLGSGNDSLDFSETAEGKTIKPPIWQPIFRRGKTHTSERKTNLKSETHPERRRPNTNIVRNGGERDGKKLRYTAKRKPKHKSERKSNVKSKPELIRNGRGQQRRSVRTGGQGNNRTFRRRTENHPQWPKKMREKTPATARKSK